MQSSVFSGLETLCCISYCDSNSFVRAFLKPRRRVSPEGLSLQMGSNMLIVSWVVWFKGEILAAIALCLLRSRLFRKESEVVLWSSPKRVPRTSRFFGRGPIGFRLFLYAKESGRFCCFESVCSRLFLSPSKFTVHCPFPALFCSLSCTT